MQRAWRLDDVAQHAVDAKAYDRTPLVGFEVDVGRLLAQRLQQERVDHPDHRRVGSRAEKILRLRDVLQEPREIGVARKILGELRDRRGLVVGIGELRRKTLGVDRRRLQRSLQHALQLRDAFERGVIAREHQNRVTVVAEREHAVRARKGVWDAPSRAAHRRCARLGIGNRNRHHRRCQGLVCAPP